MDKGQERKKQASGQGLKKQKRSQNLQDDLSWLLALIKLRGNEQLDEKQSISGNKSDSTKLDRFAHSQSSSRLLLGQSNKAEKQKEQLSQMKSKAILEYSYRDQTSYSSQGQTRIFLNSQSDRRLNLGIKSRKDKDRSYEFKKEDAIKLSKQGFQKQDRLLTIDECRDQMFQHLKKLNTQYKYRFSVEEKPKPIDRKDFGKKMTRVLYLIFECQDCSHRWTSIAGTFQLTFSYWIKKSYLTYHIQIFGEQCIRCNKLRIPLIYQTQMEAMKIFFSVILISIMDYVPQPQRPKKHYIRENHWHKTQLCEACKLGRCITQRQTQAQKQIQGEKRQV